MYVTVHKLTMSPSYGVAIGKAPWGPEGGLAGSCLSGEIKFRFRRHADAHRHALALQEHNGWTFLPESPIKTDKPSRGARPQPRDDKPLTANCVAHAGRAGTDAAFDDDENLVEHYNPLAQYFGSY
jgi:hypothetical protein